jgi:hypothetical protein
LYSNKRKKRKAMIKNNYRMVKCKDKRDSQWLRKKRRRRER